MCRISEKAAKRIQRAIYYCQRGALGKSENEAKRALKTVQRLRMRPSNFSLEIGKILSNVGAAHLQLGHFQKASTLLQLALVLKREVIGKQHESSLGTLKMLTQSSIYSCDFDLAEICLEEVLAISQESNDGDLRKYGETNREIMNHVMSNEPMFLIGGISFSGDRYIVPILDSIYLPKSFDMLKVAVENISVNSIDYGTLKCLVRFRVTVKNKDGKMPAKDPYEDEKWKVEAPPPLKSRINNSSDNFVVFVDDDMIVRKDQLSLTDENGRKIPFEFKGGIYDVFTPSSYPRFGCVHRLSGQIPTCRRFTFFRGKSFVFRWKLDLDTTYELEFVVDTAYSADEIGGKTAKIGFLFPFKYTSVQRMTAEKPSHRFAIRSVAVKPITYNETRKGACTIPVKIEPTEISLRKIDTGMRYALREESSGDFFLNQLLDLEDYSLLGMHVSFSLPQDLTVWIRTWDQPIPTGFYNTFVSSKEFRVPLVSFHAINSTNEHRKLLLSTRIEGFTQEQRTTITLPPRTAENITHLPPLIEGALGRLTETRMANICVKAVELNGSERLILDETYPIRLLAYDTIIWQVTDPSTGITEDLSRHIAAWVTPHVSGQVFENLIRKASDLHPQKAMVGYQGGHTHEEQTEIVRNQVKAIYDVLKYEYKIAYISAPICFGTDVPDTSQRVRLPKDSIETRSANCIDCTILLASALEHISLNPAVVLIPGHAFLGWETWQNSGKYEFLETTLISTGTFEEALKKGSEEWQDDFLALSLSPSKKQFLPIAHLRRDGILPMS